MRLLVNFSCGARQSGVLRQVHHCLLLQYTLTLWHALGSILSLRCVSAAIQSACLTCAACAKQKRTLLMKPFLAVMLL